MAMELGRSMFLFSTVLFFENSPCGYGVYRGDSGYRFEPSGNTSGSFGRPGLMAYCKEGSWLVEGTEDDTLVAQITRLLRIDPSLYSRNALSAAP